VRDALDAANSGKKGTTSMTTDDNNKRSALEALGPKDHAEAVALFRAQVIGPLCARNLEAHGELSQALRALSTERFAAAPGHAQGRSYSHATLERWYYRYRARGLSGLAPKRRSDRGHAQALSAEQRTLLLDIRREHPTANATLIVRTLEADGRLVRGTVSVSTLRRLYAEQGLDRASTDQGGDGRVRLRWQAERVGALWHSDVCHGPALRIAGRAVPLRIHALLDDHSRYVVAIQACATERESEMLALVVKALRLHHAPGTLYLDNGSTYNGAVLSTACGRLGISLVHAKPYDPQARGKMERFWRTLRQGCLEHMGTMQSLQDVQVRLLAFVDEHYHHSAHASLLGRTPAQVYEEGRSKDPLRISDDKKLAEALTVRAKRRVRRDGTVEIGGTSFETTAGFLAGRVVQVARSLLDVQSEPWIEHEDQRIALRVVDAIKNARRQRPERSQHPQRGIDVSFDPAGVLLDKMLGRGHTQNPKDGAS
jgi:putative transposase